MAAALLGKPIMNPVLVLRRSTWCNGVSSCNAFAGESAKVLSMRRYFCARTNHNSEMARWQGCASYPGESNVVSDEQQPSASACFSDTPENFNVQGSHIFTPVESNKGWDDPRLYAQLRYLAVAADDRSEVHGAVASQRNYWGKLIQVTVTMSMVSAAILAALNTRMTQCFSLSLTSALLCAASIFFMSLENWFQPSQLAEEQRAASRFYKNLQKEIEASLKPGGSLLKQDANLFYEAKLEKLRYLDKAFPLRLFPGGIDKFPSEVGPSVLSAPVDTSKPEINPLSDEFNNGWTPAVVEDLKRTSELLKKSDIATYVGWAKNAQKINKALAVAGPLLALVSLVANFVEGGGTVAAGCCILAALSSSFAHDAQVGMVYEMYRDVAGTLQETTKEIQRNLRLPVGQREDGELFHERIRLQLGHKDAAAIVSSDDQKTASIIL